jgi:C4-dicarboxylate transporter, DctM subunit
MDPAVIYAILGIVILGLIAIGNPIGFALAIGTTIAIFLQGQTPLVIVPMRMFNGADSFPLLAIPLFILAGQLMNSGGISRRLVDFASALVGFIRGGLAHVSIVASMLFGELSGSAVAGAAAIGTIMIPAMKAKGYPANFAAAVVSSAATTAIIIPPSIPLIIYGVTVGASITQLFLAGVIPGILTGVTMMVLAYVLARVKKYPIEQEFRWGTLWRTFRAALGTFLIPLVIWGGIFGGVFTATEAAAAAVATAFVLGVFVYREFKMRELPSLLLTSANQTATVMLIVAASALLGSYLSNEMIPQKIANGILAITQDKIAILMLLNVFFLVVGIILHSAAAIVMVVPIVYPLVQQIGVDPIHFGLIVTLNLGIGQQTPPVASVLLVTCSIAKLSVTQVMRVNILFMLSMVFVLLLITYIPEVSLFLPNLVTTK